MKLVLSFLAFWIVFTFICLSFSAVLAQNNCQAILKQLMEEGCDKCSETALEREYMIRRINLAKQFIAEPACQTAENCEIIVYLKKQIPLQEKKLADKILYNRFNTGVATKNWDEAFLSGKEIISQYPDISLDVAIILASIGFEQAADNSSSNDKYNTDTIYYAKWVIDHIQNKSDRYGAFRKYEYKTVAFAVGKSNALGWMNYIIGYITYERLKNPKNSLLYLYKATQINSATRNFPAIYKQIGDWYLSKFNAFGKRRKTLSGEGKTDAQLALSQLQKVYLERVLDAYVRAYINAQESDTKISKIYLYNRLKNLYSIRFDGKMNGLNKFIKVTVSKPFPNPSNPIIPKQ